MSESDRREARSDKERRQGTETPGSQGFAVTRLPSPRVLARHGARLLDPLTAVRLPGQPPPRPTAYRADRLVVAAGPGNERATELITRAAREVGLMVDEPAPGAELARMRKDPAHLTTPRTLTLRPALRTDAPDRLVPVAAPDAWVVLQHARALVPRDDDLGVAFGLDHVLVGTGPDVGGTPFTEGHGVEGEPFTEGHGSSGYGRPGTGGRQPVSWIGAPPVRRPDDEAQKSSGGRRPVIAVLDTGCGKHPWLDSVVTTDVSFGGVSAGHTDPATDPETSGDLVGPLDAALDSHSGHGTFICGLLHQLCPDADLLAVRVMASDGVVLESDLLHALAVLESAAKEFRDSHGERGQALDVAVLSLGYHHEDPDDAAFDAPLLTALTALGHLGVAVVAAAGNGATSQPMYPAAFAPHVGGPVESVPAGCVPVTSVAASNPDGSVALFSNAGTWINCWHPGAALVSTMPPSFRGGGQPSVAYTAPDGSRRASLDPDDFGSGFGVWSGTSFAAPVMAGRLTARWVESGDATTAAGSDVTTAADLMAARVSALVHDFPLPVAGGGR